MAPCAPVLLDEDSLWSSVKRDSTNAIVLQASAVVEACSAAFSGSSGACPYRTVVVGDNGVALAVVAQAASLAEGEKDWEWAVVVLKSEFRRKAPAPQKLTEHFVSLWNKTHPRNMAVAQPQWKKEGRNSEAEKKELRELMMSADSEANIVDTASYKVLHLLDYVDTYEYPPAFPSTPVPAAAPVRPLQSTPLEREQQQKRYFSALNSYRVPQHQPAYLPGYCHNIGRAASDACAVQLPGVPQQQPRAPGPAFSRAVTMNFEGMRARRVAASGSHRKKQQQPQGSPC